MGALEEIALTLTESEREEVRCRLGREPNLIEWAMIEATWSEHCSYKSSKDVLKELPVEGKAVLVGPGYDSGIVDVGDGYVISVHIESHNHPSAIDPYGGAATGIGGIVRDILSVGTRPLALLDALRFGDIEVSNHSRWLFKNVVRGIADYGNCIGVPTVAGELEFDPCFERNCLVDVACIGIGRREEVILPVATKPGSLVLLVGNSTGRDGLFGASFASQNLDGEDKRSAVQIPDPFIEKLLIDALAELFEKHLVLATKDLGGGGLATAISEIAHKGGTGIDADLALVHKREADMSPLETLLSESQERMLLLVEGEKVEEVIKILDKYEISFSIIGKVIEERVIRLRWGGSIVAELPTWVLVDAPIIIRGSKKPNYVEVIRDVKPPEEPRDLNGAFLRLISSPNVCSKRWVYEQYDHEVGVRTVVKPGSADAAVIKLPNGRLVAIKLDGDSKKCYIDPYRGAMLIVSENLRNLASSGAKALAIVDHQQFGDPGDPEVYWCFKESVKGIADYCKATGIPVIGGKVSFYNEDSVTGKAIKPSPLICGIGLITDPEMVMTSSFKESGDYVLILGETTNELGGSEYYEYVHGICGGRVPRVDPLADQRMIDALLALRRMGIARAAHDISKGGLAIALAEMAIAGRLGVRVDVSRVPLGCTSLRDDELLFSEGGSRILVEIVRDRLEDSLKTIKRFSVPFGVIGEVGGSELSLEKGWERLVSFSVKEIEERWSSVLEILMEGRP